MKYFFFLDGKRIIKFSVMGQDRIDKNYKNWNGNNISSAIIICKFSYNRGYNSRKLTYGFDENIEQVSAVNNHVVSVLNVFFKSWVLF